jgi:hypothetical protein
VLTRCAWELHAVALFAHISPLEITS